MQDSLVKAIQTRKYDFNIDRAFGSEPSWDGITGEEDNFRTLVMNAINWANAALDYDELKKETLEYLIATNRSIEHLDRVTSWKFTQAGKLAFLYNGGCPLSNHIIAKLEAEIVKINEAAKIPNEEGVEEDKPKVSRSENKANLLNKKASELVSWIDELIDTSILDETVNLDESEVYRKLGIDKVDIKVVSLVHDQLTNRYKKFLTEEREIDRLKDDVIVAEFDNNETYNSYVNDIHQQVSSLVNILNQLASYLGNKKLLKKSERKLGGKVATKRIENKVSNLNFKVQDNEFKLSSISPASIIGMTTLATFNTSTRKLSVFMAIDEAGLDIKGTTVHNYNEDTSYQIIIKHADKDLKEIQSKSVKRLKQVVSWIRAKKSKVSGRINEHTILLKAYSEEYPKE